MQNYKSHQADTESQSKHSRPGKGKVQSSQKTGKYTKKKM